MMLDTMMSHIDNARENAEDVSPDSSNSNAAPVSALNYQPSLAERKRNVAAMVGNMRKVDPSGAAALEQSFQQQDLIAAIDQLIRPQHMSVTNVADAYALWWATAWQGYSGDSSLGLEVLPSVARDVRAAMLATPGIKSLSNADKQQFAEILIVQAALIDAANDNAKENPAMRAPLRAAMLQAGAAMGINLDTIQLTANGFVPANGGRPSVTSQKGPPVSPPAATQKRANVADAPVAKARSSSHQQRAVEVVFTMWGDMQFHPRILFADGTYFDGPDLPPEQLDLAALKRSEPDSFGTWKKSGARYDFVDNRGDASDYVIGGGGLYKSFPATGATTLNATYKSVSGNTVGEMSMLSTSRIHFTADGRFSEQSDFSATGSGDVSGVSMAGGSSSGKSGRYRISGHSITMTFDDGRVVQKFFGFGSGGEPPSIDKDLIFIGMSSLATED